MRKSEYRRERKKLLDEQDKLQIALDAATKRLAALDLVWSDIFKGGEPEPVEAFVGNGHVVMPVATTHVIAERVNANGHTAEYVVEAVQKMSGEFGVKDILARIHTDHPSLQVNPKTVANKLGKMAEKNQIVITLAGSGRRPSVFERTPA